MQKKLPDIVLVSPAIAQNTGSIARTCAGLNIHLHLIEPLGFLLTDKGLRRSGLDYWPYALMCIHAHFESFLETQSVTPDELLFMSTKAQHLITDEHFNHTDVKYLIFGREDRGLPPDFYQRYRQRLANIPTNFSHIRSHNLAVSVGLTLGIFMGMNKSVPNPQTATGSDRAEEIPITGMA